MDTHSEQKDPRPIFSGVAIAATLSPLLGFYTLMVTHHISRATKPLEQFIHSFGYWIPGSLGSGPTGSTGSYSGKEALALLVWFISWVVFHALWYKKDLSIKDWLPIFLVGLLVVTLGFVHPVIDPVVLLILDLWG
jgi:hypothetical protein